MSNVEQKLKVKIDNKLKAKQQIKPKNQKKKTRRRNPLKFDVVIVDSISAIMHVISGVLSPKKRVS